MFVWDQGHLNRFRLCIAGDLVSFVLIANTRNLSMSERCESAP